MTGVKYIDQLVSESISGLESLCRGSLAAKEIDRDLIGVAVHSQIDIKSEHDFNRMPQACRNFIDAVEKSSDRDLLSVVTKTLRSVRFAAFTHIIGKDAVYVDRPLDVKS